MDEKKELLIRIASQLYQTGLDMEKTKTRIKTLAANGADYGSEQMRQAVGEYIRRKQKWEQLEQAYLKLRDEIVGKAQ